MATITIHFIGGNSITIKGNMKDFMSIVNDMKPIDTTIIRVDNVAIRYGAITYIEEREEN